MKSYITRTVWILSLVSLFTDTASEMLYPVMPLYLKSIGFSIVLIGVLEGVAEADDYKIFTNALLINADQFNDESRQFQNDFSTEKGHKLCSRFN